MPFTPLPGLPGRGSEQPSPRLGAQGLGEAICHRLAVEGAHVVVADLNLEGAQKVADEIVARTDRRAVAVTFIHDAFLAQLDCQIPKRLGYTSVVQ